MSAGSIIYDSATPEIHITTSAGSVDMEDIRYNVEALLKAMETLLLDLPLYAYDRTMTISVEYFTREIAMLRETINKIYYDYEFFGNNLHAIAIETGMDKELSNVTKNIMVSGFGFSKNIIRIVTSSIVSVIDYLGVEGIDITVGIIETVVPMLISLIAKLIPIMISIAAEMFLSLIPIILGLLGMIGVIL